jgi:hypothetical protein
MALKQLSNDQMFDQYDRRIRNLEELATVNFKEINAMKNKLTLFETVWKEKLTDFEAVWKEKLTDFEAVWKEKLTDFEDDFGVVKLYSVLSQLLVHRVDDLESAVSRIANKIQRVTDKSNFAVSSKIIVPTEELDKNIYSFLQKRKRKSRSRR